MPDKRSENKDGEDDDEEEEKIRTDANDGNLLLFFIVDVAAADGSGGGDYDNDVPIIPSLMYAFIFLSLLSGVFFISFLLLYKNGPSYSCVFCKNFTALFALMCNTLHLY